MIRARKWNQQVWRANLTAITFALSVSLQAQTNLVTPAEYLASRPKPNFDVGSHLPHLTWAGWPLPESLKIEIATNWFYTLDLNDANPSTVAAITNSSTPIYRMAQLAKEYPDKFKISVSIFRYFNSTMDKFPSVSNGLWVTNSEGYFVDNTSTNLWTDPNDLSHYKVLSPEASDSDLQTLADYQASFLSIINSNVPISVVLNAGEYGMSVYGARATAWLKDPRVQAATNGLTMGRYSSNKKAYQLGFLTRKINEILPDRENYVFYNTGLEQSRYIIPGYTWQQVWGWDSDVMDSNTDYPSFENYYRGGSSYTNATGTQWSNVTDLLTKHLDAVGYNISLGHPYNYSWINGGYSNSNTNRLSDIGRYMGFLKCLYTSGMIGAIQGYYEFPISQTNSYLFGGPGFDASFPETQPPHWLQQIEAASRVHALFTHLDSYIFNGDLLPGDGNLINGVPHTNHFMSLDQPSYEFTNTQADANCRVLARKKTGSDDWLICAWAADGPDRTVTVNIPTLGQINVLASASGLVYRATTSTLTLTDETSFQVKVPSPPPNFRVLTNSSP